MDKIKKLSEEIHILNALHLILEKFEMSDEANYVYDRIVEKEKEHDDILDNKLYYIKKIKLKFYENKCFKYLNFLPLDNRWELNSKEQRYDYKTQFTMPEIQDIKLKQDIDWSEFKIVPVEEEDKNETI